MNNCPTAQGSQCVEQPTLVLGYVPHYFLISTSSSRGGSGGGGGGGRGDVEGFLDMRAREKECPSFDSRLATNTGGLTSCTACVVAANSYAINSIFTLIVSPVSMVGRGTVDFVVSRLEDSLARELRADDNASIEERITRHVNYMAGIYSIIMTVVLYFVFVDRVGRETIALT